MSKFPSVSDGDTAVQLQQPPARGRVRLSKTRSNVRQSSDRRQNLQCKHQIIFPEHEVFCACVDLPLQVHKNCGLYFKNVLDIGDASPFSDATKDDVRNSLYPCNGAHHWVSC